MYQFIYALPLWLVAGMMIGAVLYWAWLTARQVRHWRIWNAFAMLLSVAVILAITLAHRAVGEQMLVLQPFHALKEAGQQPELYRELLMNVFLFVPLGLTLPQILPEKWQIGRRCCLAAAAGFLLSICIEILQYYYALGTAEIDDVICNTLGMLIGTSNLPAAKWMIKHRRRT